MSGGWLFRLLRPYTLLYFATIAASILAAVLDGFTFVLLIPFLRTLFHQPAFTMVGGSAVQVVLGKIAGPFIASGAPEVALRNVVVVLLIALVVKNACEYAADYWSVVLQESVVRDLRVKVVKHLQLLPLGYFQRTKGGQVVSRITVDADQVKTAVSGALASLLQNCLMMIVYLGIMLGLSVRLSLIALGFAPLLLFVIRPLVRRLRRRAREVAAERGELASQAQEMVGSVRLVRAYVAEAFEADRFRELANRFRKRVLRAQRFSSLTSPLSEVFGGVMVVAILWYGTTLALSSAQTLRPEELITFLVVALRLNSPIKSISNFPAIIAGASAAYERVRDLLQEPAEEGDRPGEGPAHFTDRIEYRGVSFAYGTDAAVLRDVDLEVRRGEIVAIVGPSGAGKTTLVDLLPRFYQPAAGEILFDGVPITRFTRRSLRSLMGIVSQETILLNDTVFANIAYGRNDFTQPQVEAAARAANAAEFIEHLPEGYQTVLGERGTRLSGGQRQRIAIARALLRDPPILILDEATSALDTESERLVQEAIDRLMRHRTVFVIAHRLATVQHADQIVVLAEGRIVERGAHGSLLSSGGLYRRLYDLQFRT